VVLPSAARLRVVQGVLSLDIAPARKQQPTYLAKRALVTSIVEEKLGRVLASDSRKHDYRYRIARDKSLIDLHPLEAMIHGLTGRRRPSLLAPHLGEDRVDSLPTRTDDTEAATMP